MGGDPTPPIDYVEEVVEMELRMMLNQRTKFHSLFLEKYVPPTLRDRKKDEFMALEQENMIVSTYEAKLHTLSRYPTQLVSSEDQLIRQRFGF
ncbi:hypothetical protein MTR67_035387 [Solanum verrucosum]|uniref:Retrotransposon gag domain-containing protein n=1 Tax=Solanum verrucosum TaxID=315347 RepID=A0AAF0ZK86_SOLVR|nr:hypothetical protein MTR67_035387 [Solanum verrucosum]